MYCSNCGHQLKPGETTCEICGAKAGQAPPAYDLNQGTPYKMRKKSELIAILISVFLPGLGILYAGQAGRGLMFFIGFVVLSVILLFIPLGILLILLGWLYLIYASYRTAVEYNRYLMTNGRAPW